MATPNMQMLDLEKSLRNNGSGHGRWRKRNHNGGSQEIQRVGKRRLIKSNPSSQNSKRIFQKPLKGKKQSWKTETTRQSATDTSFNEKIRKRDSGTGNKCHRCRQHLFRYAENSGCCQPLIRGGRAIRVHQSLPSSGSSARMLSTGYNSVHSQALSERSFESMGLDDIRRYINDQNELRRYGYGMAPPSVSSTGSSSGSNPTHTSTAHDSDEESDGSWGTT